LSEQERVLGGRYQVGELIGRGGMADVFEGIDLRLGRKIAIKLLKSDLANDENFESRFAQEAQASAKMAHPTIVRIYDAGEEVSTDSNSNQRRTPFIVMEYVKGKLLRDLMHERKLELAEAVGYTKQVLTALEYSHKAGVIHRDIKASNIMVTEEGQVKVMDFGIARAISESSATQAHTSGIVGTAQYFSPEQARGEAVDSRTDLYSTGVLLYEMLAGRPPFKGDTAVSVAYQHVSEKVTAPSEHNPELTAELDQVVLNALAKDREERFQTAEEFREHLLAAANGQALQKAPPKTKPLDVSSPSTEAIGAGPTEVLNQVEAGEFFKELGVDFKTGTGTVAVQAETAPLGNRITPGLLWGIGSGAGVVLIGLIVWLLALGGAWQPLTPPVDQGIAVADVSGALFEDGAQTLRDQGLLVLRITESSNEVEAGLIIRTDPVAGTSVPERTAIEVVVSSGKPETTVPFLSGLSEEAARAALEEAGLVLGVITPRNSPSVKQGSVIESVPAANEKIVEGSVVNLLVSDGQVQVPNVRNLGIFEAQRIMQAPAVGFTVLLADPVDCVGTVGTIVESQSIAPGLAPQRSTITLTLNCVPST
jgi:eukaryotic-like serine/threonine-protein kinase